jgi:SAM-dependent methyltransferase
MINETTKNKCLLESGEYFRVKHPERERLLGEVFTPTQAVLEMLDGLPSFTWDAGQPFLDPTCGNGQFLAAVLIIKMSLGHADVLAAVYGVDIMQDNVDECRQRLIDIAGDTPTNWEIVRHNIRCEDGLTYDYSFTKEPTFKEIIEKSSIAPIKQKQIQKEPEPDTFDSLFG